MLVYQTPVAPSFLPFLTSLLPSSLRALVRLEISQRCIKLFCSTTWNKVQFWTINHQGNAALVFIRPIPGFASRKYENPRISSVMTAVRILHKRVATEYPTNMWPFHARVWSSSWQVTTLQPKWVLWFLLWLIWEEAGLYPVSKQTAVNKTFPSSAQGFLLANDGIAPWNKTRPLSSQLSQFTVHNIQPNKTCAVVECCHVRFQFHSPRYVQSPGGSYLYHLSVPAMS